ncbi:adenosylcobinamide-phosphate synthase CbiB [Phocaeicola sp.]
MDIYILILPLLIGWILDRLIGDPAMLPHPVVGFGKMISFCEKRWNKGVHRIWKGGIAAVLLILIVYGGSAFILHYLFLLNTWLGIAVSAILVFYCLAGTTLIHEVKMVFLAADRSLEEGRKQVARIVGRDTSELTDQEVRTAALETLAENLSDGVIAPLFWYLLLGVPGMLAYKMVNTLDSMIGYKNERYLQFGCVAAHIDDVANYIPARLTAFWMVLSVGRLDKLKFICKYGNQHASPNSGYPESALAGILNCRFGGPHNYFGEMVYKPYIGDHERPLDTTDMRKAVSMNGRSEIIMIAFMIICFLFVQLKNMY